MKYNFVNPYNFIPFNSKVSTKAERLENEQLLTGSIDYSLQTRTPLIILNTSNDDIFGYKREFKHKSYEFFSYEDLYGVTGGVDGKKTIEPIIPGSEIRGMFRANYEIITDSCLPFLDSDQILHKRVSGFFEAGLIKKTGEKEYKVIKAEDCLLRTKGANNLSTEDTNYDKNNPKNREKYSRESYVQDDFKEGQKVYVEKYGKRRGKTLIKEVNIGRHSRCNANLVEAYIIKGMPGPNMLGMPQNKHCAHIFIADSTNKEKVVDVSRMDDVLKTYDKNNSGAYSEYADEWEKFKKEGHINDCFPVYYSEVEGNIYLSPASGTMETYKKKIKDIVDKKCACRDKNNLCPACSLFGMLGDSGVGVTSRIRFSDMTLKNEVGMDELFEDRITLQELSSPKLQNMEFYLKRPSDEAQFWTYEYWIDKSGKIHLYDDVHKLELNGRKFYWHSSKLAPAAQEKTERNITVRPLKSKVEFKGRVFFENISKAELNKLVWLINCGEKTNLSQKAHGYKLGHAKPLGYGSIAVAVDSVKVRSISVENHRINIGYLDKTSEVLSESETILRDSPAFSDYVKMTNFEYVTNTAKGIDVSYPKVDDTPEVYEWFVRNHGKHTQERKKKEGFIKPEEWTYSTKDKSVMPGSRTEMIFREYMKPMHPQLRNIMDNDLRSEVERNNNRTSLYSKGHIYEFIVTGYKKGRDGKPFFLELQSVSDTNIKTFAPFYLANRGYGDDATSVPKGSTVKLKYVGINNNNPKWASCN